MKCGRHCCLCGKYAGQKMELHHIKQAADGGADTVDNCIPLCFDCHAEVASYNPRHPKGRKYTETELKGHRDKTYEKYSGKTNDELINLERVVNMLMRPELSQTIVNKKNELTQSYANQLIPDANGRVEVPDGIKIIGEYAFNCRRDIREVTLPDGLEVIGYSAFNACHHLVRVNIPSTVHTIEDDAFARCFKLNSIRIPSGIRNISMGFCQHGSSLTEVFIPDSVVSIDRIAFWYCYKLRKIEIPSSVTEIDEEAFDGCPNLTIIAERGTTAWKYAIDHSLAYCDPTRNGSHLVK